MSLSRRLVLGAGLASLAAPALAAAPDLRASITATLKRRRVPGAAVALVKDGRTVMAEGFGLASLPFAAPVTPSSLFHMGSCSKQFTAAAVLALADEGRVDLQAPVGRYVRDLPAILGDRPVAALLSHTSGIPDYENLPGFDPDRPHPRAEMIAALAARPADFAPGEAWAYSNSAYVLLGYLIADVTGASYHEAVAAGLLRPAGLADARFDDATAIIPGRAEPYVLEDEEVRHATQMDADYSGWPDGGMLMSARDAARWEGGLQAGRPIPPATLRRMTTPVIMSSGRSAGYGYAWFLDRVRGREVHYHTGSVPGFLTFYMRIPADRVGAVVLVNLESGGAGRAMADVGMQLIEHVAPGTTPLSLQPIADDAPELTRQAQALVAPNGKPLDPALFAPEMARLLPKGPPPPRARGGPELRAFTLVERFDEGRDRVRRYRAEFADRTEHRTFAYTPDGRVFRQRRL